MDIKVEIDIKDEPTSMEEVEYNEEADEKNLDLLEIGEEIFFKMPKTLFKEHKARGLHNLENVPLPTPAPHATKKSNPKKKKSSTRKLTKMQVKYQRQKLIAIARTKRLVALEGLKTCEVPHFEQDSPRPSVSPERKSRELRVPFSPNSSNRSASQAIGSKDVSASLFLSTSSPLKRKRETTQTTESKDAISKRITPSQNVLKSKEVTVEKRPRPRTRSSTRIPKMSKKMRESKIEKGLEETSSEESDQDTSSDSDDSTIELSPIPKHSAPKSTQKRKSAGTKPTKLSNIVEKILCSVRDSDYDEVYEYLCSSTSFSRFETTSGNVEISANTSSHANNEPELQPSTSNSSGNVEISANTSSHTNNEPEQQPSTSNSSPPATSYDFPLYEESDFEEGDIIKEYNDAVRKLLNTTNLDDSNTVSEKPTMPEVQTSYGRSNMFNIDFKRVVPAAKTLQTSETLLTEIDVLNNIMRSSKLCCPLCDEAKARFSIKKTKITRFVPTLILKCTSCNEVLASERASSKISLPEGGSRKETTSLGFRFATGILESESGYSSAIKGLAYLNLPKLGKSTFYEDVRIALEIVQRMVKEMKTEAERIIRDNYEQSGQKLEDGMMNIEVSYDGTWMARGFGSLVRLGFIMDVETGIILDYEILDKYCSICTKRDDRLNKMTHDQRKRWEVEHEPNCQANYSKELSSSSMKGKIAEILFRRSTEKNLRYTTLVSDDNSTYKRLQKLNPYGNKYPIKMTSCLNHINKKIYRKLEDIRETNHLGGQGDGKLTQKMARIFTNFYRVFIKKYQGNFDLIRRNMLASIFHHAATDRKPLHHLCPTGKTSWCKYQADVANGIEIAKDWHRKKSNRKYWLNEESTQAVLAIMLKMISDDVLERVATKTQKMNDSIHSKLRGIIPKNKFSGRKQVEYVVAKTILIHNCDVKAANILIPSRMRE